MPLRIEDYALIGDTHTAALVGRDGSIDWLCLPRFDSAACFAALLGTPEHGRWLIAPRGEVRRVQRRYREGTLVLETDFETEDGAVRLIDLMPPRQGDPDLVRVVRGLRGRVPMRMELSLRLDYGSTVPWVRRVDGGIVAVAGPDGLTLRSPVQTRGEGFMTVAEFDVEPGGQVPFVLVWHPSNARSPDDLDPIASIDDTDAWWREWSERCTYQGYARELVTRSLLTLKALTYAPTGGIIAAPTTSLPERPGGVRNWDYRYSWLRDATFTLWALLLAGYEQEATAWRDWLLRAVAGKPSQLQIMYGAAGERRLPELDLPWLPGYEGSRPVRIGNAASGQFQLDVYGEVLDALHGSRRAGVPFDPDAWNLQRALLDFLESQWRQPDEGIWEVRGPRRHFTHSKVMAWVAVDRGIKDIEGFGLQGPLERLRAVRDEIHSEVLEKGFDAERGSFVQHYGASSLDANLLMIPLVGFLPVGDPRMRGTIHAIESELMHEGLLLRYHPDQAEKVDGLPRGEGCFLPCTSWLADNYALLGRMDEARALFERMAALCNDVGLLSEEYDPVGRRMLGNFPQAFTHVGLINTATYLSRRHGPAHERLR